MNPYKYKQMQSWLTRPTPPEKAKALEEKHKKDLEERRIKNRKQYDLDTVVYDNSNVVVANNEPTTKNQIKEKNKVENKKSLPPIIKPQKIYEKMVEHGDVEADDMMVKYDSTTGLFSNKDRNIAFKNVAEARKWNGTFEKYSPTVKKNNEAVKPIVTQTVKPKVKPFVKPITSSIIDMNIIPSIPDLSPPERTAEEIRLEQNFYKMMEQRERERIIRETSGLNALAPRIFGNNRKDQKVKLNQLTKNNGGTNDL